MMLKDQNQRESALTCFGFFTWLDIQSKVLNFAITLMYKLYQPNSITTPIKEN
jgi:hypothetical protein